MVGLVKLRPAVGLVEGVWCSVGIAVGMNVAVSPVDAGSFGPPPVGPISLLFILESYLLAVRDISFLHPSSDDSSSSPL